MKPTNLPHMNRQLDLFSEVLHAYAPGEGGALSNQELYRLVASRADLDPAVLTERAPVGADGQMHNLFARKVRWYQQTLRKAGIIQRVPGERGVWELTQPAGKDLSRITDGVSVVGVSTDLGVAILGSCETVFSAIDAPICLMLTSLPYPLAKPRAYGNPPESEYVDWACRVIEPIVRNLVRGGSICINVSNDVMIAGQPARSMYLERLTISLHDRLGLYLVDRLVWENRSKPPGPVQWASLKRYMLNVAWEPVLWFTNSPRDLRSDNRRVLQNHSDKHLKLIANVGEQRNASFSDGAYTLRTGSFGNPTEGKIPKNVLQFGHACKSQREYKRLARAAGLPVHGAPMPLSLAKFLIEFTTEPGDLVADICAGSLTTAVGCEELGRRWICTDNIAEYIIGGGLRLSNAPGYRHHLLAA